MSDDILERYWNAAYEFFGSDPFKMWTWGMILVTTASFWITGLLFLLIDLTGKPKFLLKYRIQDVSSYPVPLHTALRTIKQILFNQLLISSLASVPFYHAMMWRGSESRGNLPNFSRIVLELLILIFAEEIFFYYLHRLLHIPVIFKKIHNVHHEWNSPIAITAAYCHPVEHLCVNVFPLLLGPFLLGSHLATIWLWFSIGTASSMISHSGFHFPLFPNPEIHDLHHLKKNRNYGVIGLMDWLHGTNEEPKKK